MESHYGIRLAYLHSTLAHYKGQGRAHFNCEYLLNGYKLGTITIAINRASNTFLWNKFYLQSMTFFLISQFARPAMWLQLFISLCDPVETF